MPIGPSFQRPKSKDLICAKCRKRTVIATATCSICKSSFHPSCAVLYIRFKTDVVCCVRTLGHLLDSVPAPRVDTPLTSPHRAPIVPTSVSAQPVRPSVPSPCTNAPRTEPHRAPTVPTLVPVPPVRPSVPSSCTNAPRTEPHRAPIVPTLVPAPPVRLDVTMSGQPAASSQAPQVPSNFMPTLPPEWGTLDTSEQLARLMLTCMANGKMLSDLAPTVLQNSAAIARNNAEIQANKHRQAHGRPSPDVLITGIPITVPTPHIEIVTRVLARLDLLRLQTDILDIRVMNRKNPPPSQPPLAPPRLETFSLLVKFKSVDIRGYIIDAKRKVGRITVAEICHDTVQPTYQGTLFVNEFLPTSTYILYQKTRAAVRNANYNRCWIKDGNVFVKQFEASEEILIYSELDLANVR